MKKLVQNVYLNAYGLGDWIEERYQESRVARVTIMTTTMLICTVVILWAMLS